MDEDEKKNMRLALAAVFVFARLLNKEGNSRQSMVQSALRDADELIFQTERPV